MKWLGHYPGKPHSKSLVSVHQVYVNKSASMILHQNESVLARDTIHNQQTTCTASIATEF
jgi:hypothetical protein